MKTKIKIDKADKHQYVSLLQIEKIGEVLTALRDKGYSVDVMAIATASRVCDLEDAIEIEYV